MTNIKSQKKRIVTNEKARMRNRAIKSELKTAVRRVHEAVEEKDGKKAYAEALCACRLMDKAVSKGAIHKNQAANRKHGIMALVNSIATDKDRAAYKKPERKVAKATGSKKAARKAERAKELEKANAEKAKRREKQLKEEAQAAKRKEKEAKEQEAAAAAEGAETQSAPKTEKKAEEKPEEKSEEAADKPAEKKDAPAEEKAAEEEKPAK